jgi:O-acetyl-ADP-ribose deacetylase (regulator of RNase III)
MPITLSLVQGDITTATTDAIVNAANNRFWMGSGVAGAIKAAGGEVIEQEAMKKGPVIPGEAVATTAGTLRFKYIIHAAVMGQDLRTSDKLVRQATVSSLVLGDQLKLRSIAFPAFGTGVGGFPIKACAKIMTTVARNFGDMTQNIEQVVFYLFDDVAYTIFNEELSKQ